MTKPGVQKPHCELPFSAIARCRAVGPAFFDRLSTVITARPSTIGRNWMQELTARQAISSPPSLPSSSPTSTVQAPQSPSAQPSLAPVRRRP
jgi:hypothetical protein